MAPPRRKRKPVSGKTSAASGSKSKSSKETGGAADGCVGVGERGGKSFCSGSEIAPFATLSEAHQREFHTAANAPSVDRSKDNDYLEGTSTAQFSKQKLTGKTSFKTTVKNAGAFQDSNLSHINQGGNSTVNQGRIIVNGNVVGNVNENGLSGAVLSCIQSCSLLVTLILGLSFLKEFVSFDALHDSSAQDPKRRCHPGTRETVLKTMRSWIDNPDAEEHVFWLHGPAGVGKSAIAQTVSHSYERDKVAATFFFFRSDPSRNDGNRLLPTLAWQLAFSMPHAKNPIAHALNENPDLPRKAIEIQFEKLIIRPLRACSQAAQIQTPAPVIIVDGVDECSDHKLQQRFLETVGERAMGDRKSVV